MEFRTNSYSFFFLHIQLKHEIVNAFIFTLQYQKFSWQINVSKKSDKQITKKQTKQTKINFLDNQTTKNKQIIYKKNSTCFQLTLSKSSSIFPKLTILKSLNSMYMLLHLVLYQRDSLHLIGVLIGLWPMISRNP